MIRCRDLVSSLLLTATFLAAVGTMPAAAAYPGPNGKLFFTAFAPGAATADVWSIEPDGTQPVNLTDLAGGPGEGRDPSVSANGSQVAFVVGSGAAAEIWTMAADGSAARPVTANAYLDQMPSLSPDGSRIAFVSARDPGLSDLDIWTMSADGSAQTLLLDGPGREEYPQFSPDGEHVAMASEVGGDLDIAYVTAGGGPHAFATVVTEFSDLDESTPAIKPDGSRVAYSQSAGAGQADIYDVFFNGTDFLAVAADPAADETEPAYSPDGTEIVYATDAGLVVAAAGGGDPRRLNTSPATAPADPDWAVGPVPDLKPPQTKITKAPEDGPARRAGFRFSSSEAGSSFECRLDRGRFGACRSPRRYRRLDVGDHRFRVRAIDAAGNADPSAAGARFSVTERR